VVKVSALGAAQGHLEGIVAPGQRSDVELAVAERAEGSIGRSNLDAVEFYVGVKVQSLETEHMVLSPGSLELRGKHPGLVKRGFVQLLVVVQVQDILSQGAGLVKGAYHRTGDINFILLGRPFLLESPLFEAFALAAAAGRTKDNGKKHQTKKDAGSDRVGSECH
jgi:hypothetical protein